MVFDPGGGSKYSGLVRREDEQKMVVQRLKEIERDEGQRLAPRPGDRDLRVDPRTAVNNFDSTTAVSDSINRLGTSKFSRNVNDLADSWRKYFNTDPDPAVTLDLARSGVEGSIWRSVYRDIATQSGAMRGTADESAKTQRLQWLKRGVMWAGEAVGIWQGEQEAEMKRLASIEDSWMRTEAYNRANQQIQSIGQPNPLMLAGTEDRNFIVLDPAWEIWKEFKLSRAEEEIQAYWENRVVRAPDIGSSWSDAPLEMNWSQTLARAALEAFPVINARGVLRIPEILARANSSVERGESESYVLAAYSAADRSIMEGVYRFAEKASIVTNGASWIKREAITQPAVASVGWAMASSPQFAALVNAAAPSAKITAGVIGDIYHVVVPKPVRDPIWTLEQIDKAKDGAGWTFYYMVKYALYNQDTLNALRGPLTPIASMPRGTPDSNPEEWRQFHEAQTENIVSFAVGEAAREVGNSNPVMSGAMQYAGIDTAKYPTLTLLADIAFYAAGDFAIGGGMRSGWKAINGKALTQEGLKRIPWTREISEVIASETSPSKIMSVTNIWRDDVASQLAKAGTKDEVTELLTRHIADHGGRIEPGQVMLRRQLYSMAMTSDKWDLMPKVSKKFFQVFPQTSPGLHIAQGEHTAAAFGVADAFNMPRKWRFQVADEMIEATTDQARIGIMSRAWKEAAAANPEQYAKVLKFEQKRKAAMRGEEVVSGKVFAVDPETAKEISVRSKRSYYDDLTTKQQAHQTELDNLSRQDELVGEIRGTLELAEEERLTTLIAQAEEFVGNQEGIIAALRTKVDDLAITPKKIEEAAKQYYREARGYVDMTERAILEHIKKSGGIKWDDAWDQRLTYKEKMSATRNQYRAGASISSDKMAQEIAEMYPEMGWESADDLYAWLTSPKPKPKTPEDFMSYAERSLLDQQSEAGYDAMVRQLAEQESILAQIQDLAKVPAARVAEHFTAIERARAAAKMPASIPKDAKNLLDFRRVSSRQRQLEDELEGIVHELAKLDEMPEQVVVPLMPYQFGKYFYPEVPLETVSTFYTGPVSRAIERANTANIPVLGVSGDKLVSMWKRFALGSVGIMSRVAMDEPLRMLSAGWGADAALALTGKAPSLKSYLSETAGQLGHMAATDQDAFTNMRYLMDNVHPTAHVVLAPGSEGYFSGLRHMVKVTRDQVTTKRWLGEGKKGIRDWATTTVQGKAALKSRGGTLDEFVDQMDEYLTKFTHRRVNHKQYNTGVLSVDEAAEWERYMSAGDDAVVPEWFDPRIDKVISESSTGDLLHMRQDAHFMGMLEGRIPMTTKYLESVPFHKLPYISARRPRNAVVNAEGIMESTKRSHWPLVDDVFDFFDSGMQKVRDTIFAREYIGERNSLERLMKEAGREIDGDEIHQLASKYARDKVDEMTYNTQRSGLEHTLRNVVPFAPATRDFITWWGKEFIRRPSRAAIYMRLQEMPDKAEQYIPEELAGAIGMTMKGLAPAIIAAGGVAAYMKKDPTLFLKTLGAAAATQATGMGIGGMGGETVSYNPRTLTFFTGGAGGAADSANFGMQLIEQQLPGFAPTITMPAAWLAQALPERFGPYPFMWAENGPHFDLSKVPGLELINKNIPLSSRTERFIYGVTAVMHGFLTSEDSAETFVKGGELKGGDWTGLDIGMFMGFLGRDNEARRRAVDLQLQYIASQGDYDLNTEEGRKAALSEASKQAGKREFATGFLGWVMPAIPYFRDAEAADVRGALSDYRETYQMGDDPMDSPQHAAAKAWADGQRKRNAMRKEMPEYENIFEYVDALQFGDAEKAAQVGQDHPEVVAFFVSLYENNGIDADDLDVNDLAPNSLESWIAERVMGQHEVLDPKTYLTKLAKQSGRKAEYEYTTGRWNQFYRTMEDMGYQEGDAEYIEAKKQTNDEIAQNTDSVEPGAPYFRTDSRPPVLNALTKDAARDNWEERMTASIVAEYQEIKVDAVNDHDKAFMKAQFREQLIGLGLDPNALDTRQEPRTAAERTQRELMDFINSDPFGWTPKDAEAHNIKFTAHTREYMAQALEAVSKTKEWLEANETSFYDSKAEPARTAYFAYINKLGQGDPGFAGAWDYIQKPKWERLRDTGKPDSEAWDKWFDALAQRDEWLSQQDKVAVFKMTPDGSKATQEIRDALWVYADKLKAEYPDFATDFDRYAPSFWNTERTW